MLYEARLIDGRLIEMARLEQQYWTAPTWVRPLDYERVDMTYGPYAWEAYSALL